MGKGKVVFVTVGTTRFDQLVTAVTSEVALGWIKSNKYTKLVVQYGKGQEPKIPENQTRSGLVVETYRFKPSLEQDMNEADLIISHAGAGTVMEALRLQKLLVVVINTMLMDNHQTELANAMGQRKHLIVVDDPSRLQSIRTWDEFGGFVPETYKGGDENDFPQLLNSFLGFEKGGI